MVDSRLSIINAICAKSAPRSEEDELALRASLSKMTDRELQVLLSGNMKSLGKGVIVEQTSANPKPLKGVSILKMPHYTDEQAKDAVISSIQENLNEANRVLSSQHLGIISGYYDGKKDEEDVTSSKNVKNVLEYEQAGVSLLIKARDNNLSRREYFVENSNRLKEMFLTRLRTLKTSSGVSYLDSYRGSKYSRKEFAKIISDYVDDMLKNAKMEDLKDFQRRFVSMSDAQASTNIANAAKAAKQLYELKNKQTPSGELSKKVDMGSKIPEYWNSSKPMKFEEVYRYERGTEYDKSKVERYIQSKAELEAVVSSYNKYQQFNQFSENFQKSEETSAKKSEQLLQAYSEYYVNSADGGLSELKKTIAQSKLPIEIDSDGKIDLRACGTEEQKQQALNRLVKFENQTIKSRYERMLGDKSMESYQQDYEEANKSILGADDAKMLAEAMKADNMSVVERYTGNASTVGMGLTVVGGVLCFTPLAPLGGAMLTAGNTLAMGGMVAQSAGEYADLIGRDKVELEDVTGVTKNLLMNAGGFVVGFKAGKAGMKAFNKLIDKKLVETFGREINAGNRAEALKSVIKNPEYLKNFMKAAGAKLSTDFVISYVGDLVMMGVLDTDDDWKSLLKSNLIGLSVGMSGDIKDVAGVGKKRVPKTKPSVPQSEKVSLTAPEESTSTETTIAREGVTAREQTAAKGVVDGAAQKLEPATGKTETTKTAKAPETNLKPETEAVKPKSSEIKVKDNPFKDIDTSITYEKNGGVPEKEVKQAVDIIMKRYAAKEEELKAAVVHAGFGETGKLSMRLKSEQSLYDKIANYMKDHKDAPLEAAIKDVRDAFGARTIVDSQDFTTHPEVQALLAAGKEREAMLRAAELQSEPELERLKNIILEKANSKDGLDIARISNYVADDGIPYFSENQLARLKQFGADHGVNVVYVEKIDKSDPNYAKMKAAGIKPTTKAQPSGYPALQINFKTKTGEIFEYQYRGEKVNRFAEGEHIPYDLRTGKDIIGKHKELEPLYNPIKKLLSKENMTDDNYAEYNRYLKDYYNHLRKQELGFESTEPKLADYGKGYKFDERLNAENLIALHEIGEKLKKGKITQQEAIRQYNATLEKNSPQNTKPNFETKIRKINALLKSENAKYLSDEVKNTISQNLPKIKDEKLLNAIGKELIASDNPNALNLLVMSEIENFKDGGYEALSPELKRIIQPPRFYTNKNYDMQYEEIKQISDPVIRQEKLEKFNLQIESELVLSSAPKVADYLYENYLLKTLPEKYKDTVQEISSATGKKVLPMNGLTTRKNDNYICYQPAHLENYNSLKDYQKDWIKKHADKLLTDADMYTDKQTQTIRDFTPEKIQLIEDRNIVDIAGSDISGIKALSDISDENFKRIKDSGLLEYSKFRMDKTTGKELPFKRIKDIVELVEKSSDIELKRIIDRNILDITPKGLLGIDNDLVLALARLDDSTWNYIKDDLGLIKDNVLDIFHDEGAKSLDDVADAMGDMNNASVGIIKYLDNIQNTRATTETLTALGVKPEVAAAEAGHLLEGVPSDEIKDYTLDKAYWETNMAKVEDLRNTVLGHPEYYVNGTYPTKADCDNAVNKFFDKHKVKLAELSSAMDKEGVNHLMRKRFEDAEEYLDTLNDFNVKDLDMLKKLCNSVNESGKPFMPTQKVEFIDLISAYKLNNLDMSKMQTMVENGRVNLPELQTDLFNDIMKKSGMSDEEIAKIPPEKLAAWDIRYSHLLAKEIQGEFTYEDSMHVATKAGDKTFSDIIKAANLDDFNRYIHDEGNIYGKSNKKTSSEFQQLGMDYEKWLHPSKDSEVKLQIKDKNAEQLSQISNQLLEDINVLRQTPVKGFLNKQFPKCIGKNGDFVIPSDVMQSKSKLNDFTNNIIKQLEPVWNRAQGNLNNPDPKRVATAKNTLTILEHFKARLADIAKVETSKEAKVEKDLDLTIKMWDRVPQKDLFQGNYSTCCIGMGGGNGSAMPHYLLNTAYNMIEINDNVTGKTIGNALVYFVKDSSGKPTFIVDNIEINNGAKPSDEGGIAIRNKIVEYAANVAKEVTGKDDVNIYMGGDYNDVPCNDLPKSSQQVSFLGDIDCDNIYMDLYKGWIDKDKFTNVVNLFKLK